MSGYREIETTYRIEVRRDYQGVFLDNTGENGDAWDRILSEEDNPEPGPPGPEVPEAYEVKILGFFPAAYFDKPTNYRVVVDRLPDAEDNTWPFCLKIPMRIEDTSQTFNSLGAARARAKTSAEVLACGRAPRCPGIYSCYNGAPCPYRLK